MFYEAVSGRMTGKVVKNGLENVWKNAAMAKSKELLRETEKSHENISQASWDSYREQ
jgi:hypothetical protein